MKTPDYLAPIFRNGTASSFSAKQMSVEIFWSADGSAPTNYFAGFK
jgi:hypothetical protein